jgi:hypothetical protein
MHRLTWIGWLTLLWLALLAPAAVQAKCVEVKNDSMADPNNPIQSKVVPFRNFCQREAFGAAFKITQDLNVQKIRLLISGNNKDIMDTSVLSLRIYEDVGGKVGKQLFGGQDGIPYTFKGTSITDPNPKWLEISDQDFKVKKGQVIRVVFHHEADLCTDTSGSPCATNCKWLSATTDTGPIKAGTNFTWFIRRPWGCPSMAKKFPKDPGWVDWNDFTADCKPVGNLILRLYGHDGAGDDCKKSGGQTVCQAGTTAACTGPGNCTGTKTCNPLGTGYSECKCKNEKVCEPGTARNCQCPDGGTKLQSCNDQGSGYKACPCTTGGTNPTLTSITPKEGSADKDTQVTILGNNFAAGIKFFLGTTELTGVQLSGTNAATAVVPKGMEVKKYDLTARATDGKEAKLTAAYEVTGGNSPKPVVEKITPPKGLNDADIDVTILGQNFKDGADVRIGSIRLNNVKVRADSTITASVPKGVAAGKFDVVVINPDKQEGTLGLGYEIVEAGCGCTTVRIEDGTTPLVWVGFFLVFLLSLRRRRV